MDGPAIALNSTDELRDPRPALRPRRRATAAVLQAIGLANAGIIAWIWLHAGGLSDIGSTADAFTSAGRLTALLGAYLALIAVLLLARIPVLENLVGFGGLTAWHRQAARACLALLLAHTALTTVGLALGDEVS